jgi:hypothetical protein
MSLFLFACLSVSSSPSWSTSSKAEGETGDSSPADSPVDTGDSEPEESTGESTPQDSESGITTEDSGRTGQSAAELSGEPGGFGCATVTGSGLWGVLLLAWLFKNRS